MVVLSNKVIVSLGRLTYGMYIVHVFVLQLVYAIILKPLGGSIDLNTQTLLSISVGLPSTFLLAWLTWQGYEKHFLKLKYKFAPIKSGYMAAQGSRS